RIRQVDAGFDPHNLLTLEISLHGSRYSTPQQQDALFRQLIERLESLPGARSAGAVNVLPLSGNNVSGSFAIEGRAPAPPGQKPNTNRRIVTPHYFAALGMPLLRGREFTEADSADAPPVVDRKSTRLNSSHGSISYAVFCLKKKKADNLHTPDERSTQDDRDAQCTKHRHARAPAHILHLRRRRDRAGRKRRRAGPTDDQLPA